MCVGAGKVSRKIFNPAEEDSLVVHFKGIEQEKSFSAGTEKTGPRYSQWLKNPKCCFLAVEYVHASLDKRLL